MTKAAAGEGDTLIRITGLRKLYQMGSSVVRALDGVDLTIRRGEFVAIIGASGSGKSTMMHLLGCLDRPTGGSYYLAGRDVAVMSDRELAALRNRYIGFVFQTFNLVNRTSALENVAMPMFYARKRQTRDPAARALERVALAHRSHHKPNELSGGERQRVAIARAIVNDPLLVLADEPTGNLDSRTGEQIMSLFHALNEQGVTVVLVTHELDVAVQARRIVQMRDGKIIADLPTDQFMKSMGISPEQKTALPVAAASNHRDGPPLPPEGGAPDELLETIEEGEEAMPRRLASGANAALTCGILGAVFFLGATIAGMAPGWMGFDIRRASPTKLPPTPVLVLSLVAMAALLLAIISSIIAIFWGRAVRRRIRQQPDLLSGGRRAAVGMLMGGLSVLAIVALPLASAVLRKMADSP